MILPIKQILLESTNQKVIHVNNLMQIFDYKELLKDSRPSRSSRPSRLGS